MPFDFGNPWPTQPYDPPHGRKRRYWPIQKSIENLAYTPSEIRSWRSVLSQQEEPQPLRRLDCHKQCVSKGPQSYYAENYVQEQLKLDNPALLAAIKNTPLMRDVPSKPIKFVPPRFLRKNKRSHYHLLLPQKDRGALCKISENLYNEHELFKKELVSRKGREAAAREISSIPSLASGTDPNPLDLKKKSEILNKEGLFSFIRKRVEADLEIEEEKKLKKHFFPSKIAFESNYKKSMARKPRYSWQQEGGMEAMCANYPGTSLFHESPSHITVKPYVSEELIDSSLDKKPEEHGMGIPREMMKLFLNAPRQTTKSHLVSPDQYHEFNHFGLLETSKSMALENCLKKLYRRERKVKVPVALIKNVYGPLKGMPASFKYEKPKLPPNLQSDGPPTQEELMKVEKAMKYEKKLRHHRKAKGVETQKSTTRFIGQFSKPNIESLENITPQILKKSIMTLEDYPKKHNERTKRDSSDSLFCEVGATRFDQDNPQTTSRKRLTWVSELVEKSSVALLDHKNTWKQHLDAEFAATQRLPTLADMASSSSSSEGEDVKEDEYEGANELKQMDVKDSRELLPYPDIAYSAIQVPREIEGIESNWLYRKLADDQRSASSSNSDNEQDDGDNYDEKEDEEEELQEGISDTSIMLDNIFKKAQPHLTKSLKLRLPSSTKIFEGKGSFDDVDEI